MTINGSGSLTVNGNMKNGIVSKDDLVITGGTITVNAKIMVFAVRTALKLRTAILQLSPRVTVLNLTTVRILQRDIFISVVENQHNLYN